MATLLLLVLTVVLFALPFYIIYKPPSLLISYFAWRWPDVLWRVSLPSGQKLVALTIDDAPSEHTREILSVLREHNAHATFFVIGGQVSGREEILRDIVRGGHELGNHAMHDEPARSLTDDELEAQIHKVQRMIEAAYEAEDKTAPRAGSGKLYFRPGSGFFSDRMRQLVAKLGFRLVLGSIYPHDAQISYWWLNARHVLSMLKPGGIIINHDRRSWTPPMLSKVLPKMKKKGYQAVTLTELLAAAAREEKSS
ncbi:carbohydrate esterase family 4 protein [Thozetella sp. PMI_491]|nr:carbohydrate esterase family 4 protein [Thozetella sp. PMI_491]